MKNVSTRLMVCILVAFGLATVATKGQLAAQAQPGQICLLGVCTEGSAQPAQGAQQPPVSRKTPSPAPEGPDGVLNNTNELANLQPSDTSTPVTEWAGMSQRDFQLAILNDFIAAGYCIDANHVQERLSELSSGARTSRECPRCAREANESVQNAPSVAANYRETTEGLTVAQQQELLHYDARAREWARDHKKNDPWLISVPGGWITIGQQIKRWRAANGELQNKLKDDLREVQKKLGKKNCEKEYWPRAEARVNPEHR